MKVLRAIVLTILLLIVLAVSANRFLGGLWGMGADPVLAPLFAWLPAWMNPLMPGLQIRLWAAAILFLLAVYWILCLAIWTRRPRPLTVRTLSGGTMLIHPGAILKFIKLQIDGHPAVISSRVRVRQTSNNNLAVSAGISVQPIESLPVIDEQIKQSIRDGLSQVMGIEKIDQITLLIDIDEKNLALKPGPDATPEPEPIPPARAPLAAEPATIIEPAPVAAVQETPAEIHFEEPPKQTEPEPEPEPRTERDRLREQEQIFLPPTEDEPPLEEKPEEK